MTARRRSQVRRAALWALVCAAVPSVWWTIVSLAAGDGREVGLAYLPLVVILTAPVGAAFGLLAWFLDRAAARAVTKEPTSARPQVIAAVVMLVLLTVVAQNLLGFAAVGGQVTSLIVALLVAAVVTGLRVGHYRKVARAAAPEA